MLTDFPHQIDIRLNLSKVIVTNDVCFLLKYYHFSIRAQAAVIDQESLSDQKICRKSVMTMKRENGKKMLSQKSISNIFK